MLENSCGVWSHDRREKSLSATLNSHLASAVLVLIAELSTIFICRGGVSFAGSVMFGVDKVVVVVEEEDEDVKEEEGLSWLAASW